MAIQKKGETITIIRDPFTERLLTVYVELIKLEALGQKKSFSDAIELSQSGFSHIERQLRNYPADHEKRKRAGLNLLHKYGVNPDFLEGKGDKQFLRNPEKATKTVTIESASINFDNKRQKQDLLDELATTRARVIHLEAELEKAIKELDIYRKSEG